MIVKVRLFEEPMMICNVKKWNAFNNFSYFHSVVVFSKFLFNKHFKIVGNNVYSTFAIGPFAECLLAAKISFDPIQSARYSKKNWPQDH